MAATGWDALALADQDLTGAALDVLAGLVEEQGVPVVDLELLTGWWAAPVAPDHLLLRAAARLGTRTIKASAEVPPDARGQRRLARRLHDAGAVLDAHGLRLALEPMATSASLSVADAVALIDRVDHPAVGLCLDVWHARREGLDDAALRRLLPGCPLHIVELDDGAAVAPGADAGIDHRLLPGEGDLDVAGFVRVVRDLGFAGPWSVEVLSEAHRALPLGIALERARRAATSVLAA